MSLFSCTDILTAVLLMSILVTSSRSMSFSNRTKMSEKEPLTTHTAPLHRTLNTTILPRSTPTLQSTQTTKTSKNVTFTTIATSEEHFQVSTSTEGIRGITSTPAPQAEKVQATKTRGNPPSTILAVSFSLGFCLLSVGVAAAVFFVRWKRIKKMKEGFQEEMAVICLHDELASEALYSSWKPFMDGNENNKVKLVIGTPTSDETTSRANT